MSTHNISLSILVAFVFAFLPSASHAYYTTSQTAIPLSDTAALFLIEYSFGLEDQDMYMPVLTQRDLDWESTEKKVGYAFTENGHDAQVQGAAAGLVVSKAPVVDGMYKIAKGTAEKMTLLVILTTDQDALEDDYALQVTKLPYFVDRGDEEMQTLQLNPSELQYYVTEEIELNSGNFH